MPFYDFDAAREERKSQADPLEIRILGKTEKLPGEMPGTVMLAVFRARKEARSRGLDITKDVPGDMVLDVMEAMVGMDRITAWFEGGLSMDDLGELLKVCWDHWTENPNSEAPGNGAKSSTKTSNGSRRKSVNGRSHAGRTPLRSGQSLRPTSSASTD